jgi:hypothetical protein
MSTLTRLLSVWRKNKILLAALTSAISASFRTTNFLIAAAMGYLSFEVVITVQNRKHHNATRVNYGRVKKLKLALPKYISTHRQKSPKGKQF